MNHTCLAFPAKAGSHLKRGAMHQLAGWQIGSATGPACGTGSRRIKENRAASRPGTIYVYANNFSGRG